jgi:hypothetical protein
MKYVDGTEYHKNVHQISLVLLLKLQLQHMKVVKNIYHNVQFLIMVVVFH